LPDPTFWRGPLRRRRRLPAPSFFRVDSEQALPRRVPDQDFLLCSARPGSAAPSSAPVLDGSEAITDFRPSKRSLPPGRLGTIDGMLVGSGSVLPATIPPLGESRRSPGAPRRSRSRGNQARHGVGSVAADVTIRSCGTSFKITTVYGPSSDAEKRNFLDEAIAAKPDNEDAKWLILGDFTLSNAAILPYRGRPGLISNV
jgi:hypothetical protein